MPENIFIWREKNLLMVFRLWVGFFLDADVNQEQIKSALVCPWELQRGMILECFL